MSLFLSHTSKNTIRIIDPMKIRYSGLVSHMEDWEKGIILVLKISRRQNSMKCSRAHSRDKMWSLFDVSGTVLPPPTPFAGRSWWLGRIKTVKPLSVLVLPSHQQHPESGDGVSSWNYGEPGKFVAVVCPRKFHSGQG